MPYALLQGGLFAILVLWLLTALLLVGSVAVSSTSEAGISVVLSLSGGLPVAIVVVVARVIVRNRRLYEPKPPRDANRPGV